LKIFDCLLIEDGQGGLIVKYIRKNTVPEAIGVPYAAENHSSHSSLDSDNDEIEDEILTQSNSSILMQNRIGCDEII
jgi:hypothetical protein